MANITTILDTAIDKSYETIKGIHVLDPNEHIQLAKALHVCAEAAQDTAADIRNGVAVDGVPAFLAAIHQYWNQVEAAYSLVHHGRGSPIEDYVKCRRLLFESWERVEDSWHEEAEAEAELELDSDPDVSSIDTSGVSEPETPDLSTSDAADQAPSPSTSTSTKPTVTTRKAPGFSGYATTSKWRGYRVYAGPQGGYFVIQNKKKKYVTADETSFTQDKK